MLYAHSVISTERMTALTARTHHSAHSNTNPADLSRLAEQPCREPLPSHFVRIGRNDNRLIKMVDPAEIARIGAQQHMAGAPELLQQMTPALFEHVKTSTVDLWTTELGVEVPMNLHRFGPDFLLSNEWRWAPTGEQFDAMPFFKQLSTVGDDQRLVNEQQMPPQYARWLADRRAAVATRTEQQVMGEQPMTRLVAPPKKPAKRSRSASAAANKRSAAPPDAAEPTAGITAADDGRVPGMRIVADVLCFWLDGDARTQAKLAAWPLRADWLTACDNYEAARELPLFGPDCAVPVCLLMRALREGSAPRLPLVLTPAQHKHLLQLEHQLEHVAQHGELDMSADFAARAASSAGPTPMDCDGQQQQQATPVIVHSTAMWLKQLADDPAAVATGNKLIVTETVRGMLGRDHALLRTYSSMNDGLPALMDTLALLARVLACAKQHYGTLVVAAGTTALEVLGTTKMRLNEALSSARAAHATV